MRQIFEVLLLRAEENSSEIKILLRQNNISFFHEPLFNLKINDISQEKLNFLQQNSDFLIITSQNALTNLQKITIPVLVVGEKLSTKLQEKFSCKITYAAANAADLYQYIEKNSLQSKKFLYLHGKNITFDFKKYLSHLQEMTAYEMIPADDFSVPLCDLLRQYCIKNILFFSVNCVKYFSELIKKNNLIYVLQNCRLIFFSENIANQALKLSAQEKIVITELQRIINFLLKNKS